MSKVVHLSDDAHAQAKDFCRVKGLKMSDWVAGLICQAIEAGSEPAGASFTTLPTTAFSHGVPEESSEELTTSKEGGLRAGSSVRRKSGVKGEILGAASLASSASPKASARNPDEGVRALVAKKKVLRKLDENPQTNDDGIPVYAQPPFWARSSRRSANGGCGG